MPKKRITTVYTGLGDDGKTSLLGGKRVRKSSLRVTAYGDVDELNSVLGVACTKVSDPRTKELLGEIQNALFTVGREMKVHFLKSPHGADVGYHDSLSYPLAEKFLEHSGH